MHREAGVGLVQGDAGETDDAGQRRPDLVGHRGEQPATLLTLLDRLVERVGQLVDHGAVGGDVDDGQHRAALGHGGGREPDPPAGCELQLGEISRQGRTVDPHRDDGKVLA